MDRIEQLERLSNLLDDGKISADEYESLKREVLAESAPTSEQSDAPPPAKSPPQQEAPERQTTPGLYWLALVLGIASVFLGVNLYLNGYLSFIEQSSLQEDESVITETETVVTLASLGFTLDDLDERWNSWEENPYIFDDPRILETSGETFDIFEYELGVGLTVSSPVESEPGGYLA